MELHQRVEKDLRKLNKENAQRVIEQIEALGHDPHPAHSRSLRGYSSLYRIRVGDYRVIYIVDDGELTVIALLVGHRRDVYRALARVLRG